MTPPIAACVRGSSTVTRIYPGAATRNWAGSSSRPRVGSAIRRRALSLIETKALDRPVWISHFTNHAMALALYRCGRFEEAIRQIHLWDGRRPDFWVRTGLDASLLAMALHRLGREEDARRAMEDAEAVQSRTARTILEHDGELFQYRLLA